MRFLIRHATTPADFARARALFEEYAAWLGVDLCFQGFAEELATLPGDYAPPRGRLLLAGSGADVSGCIALREIAVAGAAAGSTGEVKRLYVVPAARGTGQGVALAGALIAEARGIGFTELKLDTLEWMTEARSLYERLGFVRCAPYYHNPLAGAVYMSLAL